MTLNQRQVGIRECNVNVVLFKGKVPDLENNILHQRSDLDIKEIVGKLIENSETFQNKTKFSQEKFLKKKAKKYHQYILIRRPSIRLLMQIHYKAGTILLIFWAIFEDFCIFRV